MTLEQRLRELVPYPKGTPVINPWKPGINVEWSDSLQSWVALADEPASPPRLDGTLESVLFALQYKMARTAPESVTSIIESWARIDWSTSVEELHVYSTKRGIGLCILEDASWAAYTLTPDMIRRTRLEDRLTGKAGEVVWSD